VEGPRRSGRHHPSPRVAGGARPTRRRCLRGGRRLHRFLLAVAVLSGAGCASAPTPPPPSAPQPVTASPAATSNPATAEQVIVLPGAKSSEGVAAGEGSTFYAGELFTGDIYRGDVRQGTAEEIITAPPGRWAVGMMFDPERDRLFVAGGFTGQAYVYDINRRETLRTYQFAPATVDENAPTTLVNDVALTPDGAWFTDSLAPVLYFVPTGDDGALGEFRSLQLKGPAGNMSGSGQFDLNGIRATPDGNTLIVANATTGRLLTINPQTGDSAFIDGVTTPGADGIELRDQTLWVVHTVEEAGQRDYRVTRLQLSPDLRTGTIDHVIRSPHFESPTTAALVDSTLAVVNAKFNTGIPPTAGQYEIVTTAP
jgi:sugar lactone lactonase YvrE